MLFLTLYKYPFKTIFFYSGSSVVMSFFAALQLQPEFSPGNFDLYQDRAPELFNRARAKLLLEIEGRPTIRVLRYLDSVAQKLKKEERSGDLEAEGVGLAYGSFLENLC